jgi:3-deoxy-D-manno-octulosonate 8-phosphate phosphatase (KDO 8-P phosphatase)
MYYSTSGEELKRFNTYDSAGVLFARLSKKYVAIITGESSVTVINRAKKLQIDHVFTGVSNKVEVTEKLIDELGISWDEVAFIGDDINDYQLLVKVGVSACPSQAPSYIKEIVDVVLPVKGGNGAFRAFVELILRREGKLEAALESYFANLKFTQ